MSFQLPAWPQAYGQPPITGCIRQSPEDFFVEEIPRSLPDGEGQHVWLSIEKRLLNTDQVAGQLAKIAAVPRKAVSFAGMKDRNAVTRQWFSVDLAGKPEPDWQTMNSERIRVLEHARHGRKLRRGYLDGNRFELVLRKVTGDTDQLQQNLAHISEHGVPNYFGEQRFGRDNSNLTSASQLMAGQRLKLNRNQRGLIYSAARSYLFNMVLARRVVAGNWRQIIEGDLMALADKRGFFTAHLDDRELQQRLDDGAIHPTGPLWGSGSLQPAADALESEQAALAGLQDWQQWLERQGLEMDRRPLRLLVQDMQWQLEDDGLYLQFSLTTGGFATSVLRECVNVCLNENNNTTKPNKPGSDPSIF
jgi:tRNA pseudouridine13 synthase